jgi:hypothetical protein
MTRERDISAEAHRLVEAGTAAGVTVRLIGGLAIAEHARQPLDAALMREPKDIDVVVRDGAAGRALVDIMAGDGYEPDTRFNAMSGGGRLLLHDEEHGRQVDVFVGTFEMCHVIPVADRLDRHPVTVPAAELLLTKLQIVELNRKDIVDACVLLASQPVVTSEADGIEGDVVADLCARDWGLWRTATMNLDRIGEHLPPLGVGPDTAARISSSVAALRSQIDDAPKTRGWKMRSRVGDRVRWYREPDEVDEG